MSTYRSTPDQCLHWTGLDQRSRNVKQLFEFYQAPDLQGKIQNHEYGQNLSLVI